MGTLYFKETTLDDIIPARKKKLHFGTSQRLYQIRQQCDKVCNHSSVHFLILIFISQEKFLWKAKRKSISRMVIKKLTATKGASNIALHTNLLCR